MARRKPTNVFDEGVSFEDMTKQENPNLVKHNTDSGVGKQYKIIRESEGLYTVKWEGGGRLPTCLEGKFTSIKRVEDMINRYKIEKGLE